MKVSIITVLNTVNYGSALQTFATQRFFEKMGIEIEFVDYWRKDQTTNARIHRIITDKKKTLKQWVKKPLRDILEIKSIKKSEDIFRKFIVEKIHLTPKTYFSYEELVKDCPQADVYATGSDQMWNSGWNQGIEKSFFLEYAPENKKRIAFATSIGKTQFEKEEADEIIPLIKKYDLVTLREQSAVDLLKEYDIDGQLVLDPTLTLKKEDWFEILPKNKRTKPYLLVYQLHMSHNNADFTRAVQEIAARKGLEIVRVVYSYSDRKVGEKVVLPGVFEFLSLIRGAGFIVTDSFHGTAFSINFNKQFAVIYPEFFGTRMDNILRLTNLQNRRYRSSDSIEKWDTEIVYDEANRILEERRTRVEDVFKKYFEVTN